MTEYSFTKGLHDLGNGCWAYLQPDGGWGWSNAGLIADGGESLLVDTLFNLPMTAEMLAEMRRSEAAAANIGTLVNTHSNGDHTWGNQLVEGAEIIGSRACRDEMERMPPENFIERVTNWRDHGEPGALMYELMGRKFDFAGVVNTPPTRVFDDNLSLTVGSKRVELVHVGPAHTRGDVLVHVPADRTVFTGDIVFSQSHPIIWAGPVNSWIGACDKILRWDVDIVVPGHGPIGDLSAVRELKDYLVTLRDLTRARFDAGLDWVSAAEELIIDHFTHWIDRERIFLNVNALYREFGGGERPSSVTSVYEHMAKWYWAQHPHSHPAGKH